MEAIRCQKSRRVCVYFRLITVMIYQFTYYNHLFIGFTMYIFIFIVPIGVLFRCIYTITDSALLIELCMVNTCHCVTCVAWWALRDYFFFCPASVCLSVTLFRHTFSSDFFVTLFRQTFSSHFFVRLFFLPAFRY